MRSRRAADAAGGYALAQGGLTDPARIENDVEVAHVDRLWCEQDCVQGIVAGRDERLHVGHLVEGCPTAQLDGGTLAIYDGVQPENPNLAVEVAPLATLRFSTPAFAAPYGATYGSPS